MKNFFESIYRKLNYRIQRPILILYDVNQFYHKIKYYTLDALDPGPPLKKGEIAREYFDRVDPKYGLRFYEFMRSRRMDIDVSYALGEIEKTDLNKKDKKIYKDFIITCDDLDRKVEANYQRYLIRSEILKSQNS